MGTIACSPEGVEELRKTASRIIQDVEDIKTETTTMKGVAEEHSGKMGPHEDALNSALEDIASAVDQSTSPAAEVSNKLNRVATRYEGVIAKKRYQTKGK